MTALMLAARQGFDAVVHTLLEGGQQSIDKMEWTDCSDVCSLVWHSLAGP